MLPEHIFRAYDIRGIVENELTPHNCFQIAKALAALLIESKPSFKRSFLVLGYDGRLSSVELADSIKKAMLESGINVILLGGVTTPMLYFASHYFKADGAVMITGSHNPPEYNGLKILLQQEALYGAQIKAIYHRAMLQNFYNGHATAVHYNILKPYEKLLREKFNLLPGIKIVVDSGNGIAGPFNPAILSRLGCDVTSLFGEVDGQFPNHHPDPAKPENLTSLIHMVKEKNAALGIAFDGDGDRLGVVTPKGQMIWPDQLLYLFSLYEAKRLNHVKMIYDVKSSQILETLKSFGVAPIIWKTGHSFIKAKMKQEQAHLAGEMSGHFFFKEWFGFDDALFAALLLLKIMSETELSLDALMENIPKRISTAEISIPVQESEKFEIIQKLQHVSILGAKKITIDGLRLDFSYGYGVIRASNTTPNLIMRFEADTQENLERIQSLFTSFL